MKRLFSFLLAVTIIFSSLAGLNIVSSATDLPSSGSCGENVTYTFDSTSGELTISGSGAMENYMHNGPFYCKKSIVTVIIKDGVTSIGDTNFYGCSALKSVTIPDSVTSIGDSVFFGCSGLTSVTIPDSVTSIGNEAFNKCSGLKKVIIHSLEAWCNITFGNSTSMAPSESSNPLYYAHDLYLNNQLITDLIIPDTVESVSQGAFIGCTGLKSIFIPDSVKYIGNSAFYGCNLNDVTIPNSVKSIGNYAFKNCKSLTNITIGNSVTSIGDYAFYGCSELTSVVIPDSVTSIGYNIFSYCSKLEEVVIGNSVTSIIDYAFSNCVNLSSITIGNSVQGIYNEAFYGCRRLKSIHIPESVKTIWFDPFSNCGITEVYINSIEAWCNISFYSWYSNPAMYLYLNGELVTDLVIPNSVKSINPYVFAECKSLTNVTIPDSVTDIGKYAFKNCKNLKTVTVSDSVTNIGLGAFYGCKRVIYGGIADGQPWGANEWFAASDDDFLYGDNHKTEIKKCISNNNNLSIPNSVTSIGTSAFSGCGGLTSITIPNSVTSIGNSAFYGCSGLTSISIPNSVTSIGNYTFKLCSGLTNITIPDSVTSIGDYAFEECYGLTSIEIPDSVTNIGNNAFYDCNISVIYGKYGSKAEEYAKSHNIRFVEPNHQHNYVSSGIVKNSTCSVRGQELFSCICGATYKEFLPLKEHTYQQTYRVQKAAPSKQGKITINICSVCGNEETQPIFSPKEIVLSANSFIYSAKQCKPAVTVKDSAGKVIGASNYTVTYSNNINAGTAKVTVTFKGDSYEGSMSKAYKILPKKLTNCYLDNTFTYTGKAITPVPYYYKTVVQTFYGEQYTEKALTYFKKGTEYTIAVSGKHTQVGTYTVVIRFCGNYTGRVKKSIQIRPKPVTKSNIKPYSETSVKVSWNKVAGVSGYSVFRYNIQKNKWVRYKNTTATSMIVPRINASYTDVWLRIWTYKKVGGKVYYNESGRVHYTSEYTKPSKPIVKLVNTDFGNFVIKFNRVAWHQTQLSDNKAFSNKGNNICVTYRNYNEKVTATGWGSAKKYYVRSREYFYDNNNKLVVGPWSDIKTITTY